jgi:hypothetical protein
MDREPKKSSRWLRRLALTLLLISGAFAAYLYFFREDLAARFEQIEIGMNLEDVERLLGRRADTTFRMKGRIENATTFVANDHPPADLRDHYRHYDLFQWNSAEITIVVVADDQGEVACRYTAEGNLAPWHQRVLDAIKRGLGMP